MFEDSKLSLSQISKKASLGLPFKTQSTFAGVVSANASLIAGNTTAAFNNQLNGFLNDLNAKRASIQAELADKLLSDPNFKGYRNKGVSLAWEYEKADVMMGGNGTVEGGWSNAEKIQIKNSNNGHPKVYDPFYDEFRTPEGHHINNVADHKDLQANPDNIRFYKSREDHVNKGHNGDVNNPSSGKLIDKNAHLKRTNRQRIFRNELRGVALSAGIGFGIGFALSAIVELATKGVSLKDIGGLIVRSTKAGLETAFISTMGYGASRLVTTALTKLNFNLVSKAGVLVNFANIGLTSIAVISMYQYMKLRYQGVDSRTAAYQVAKQSAFSASLLTVSIIAQGLYGGYAGLIVSTSIGIVCFAFNMKKAISQSEQEERLRTESIKYYKEYVLD